VLESARFDEVSKYGRITHRVVTHRQKMETLNKCTHNFDLRSVYTGRRNVQLVDIRSATTSLLNGVSDFSFACCSDNRDAKNRRDPRTVFVTHGHIFSYFIWVGFSDVT
jgi:hypothetical protein